MRRNFALINNVRVFKMYSLW